MISGETILRHAKDFVKKHFPFVPRIWRALQPGGVERPSGTRQFSARIWDKQYRAGYWGGDVDTEVVPYQQICRCIGRYSLKRSILDLGCGRGSVAEYMRKTPVEYSFYIGIDHAKQLIRNVRRSKSDKKTRFIAADFLKYKPERKFSVIVCSEILYYIKVPHTPLDTLRRYADFLNPDGVFIISQYQGEPESRAVTDLIRCAEDFQVLEDTTITNEKGSVWVSLVVRPAF